MKRREEIEGERKGILDRRLTVPAYIYMFICEYEDLLDSMCIFVLYIYIYTCTLMFMCTCIYIYIYICISEEYVCVYDLHMGTLIYVYIPGTYIHILVYVYNTCMCIYLCIYMYMHVSI